MRLKHSTLVALLSLAVTCGVMHADTLKLVSTSGQAVDGVYIYPYNMSYNGSSATTSMMCINYNDEVTINEQWYVQGQTLSTSSSLAYKEDAYIFSKLSNANYTTSEVQFAAWDILDPGVGGNTGLDANALSLVQLAITNAPLMTNAQLSKFEIFTPTSDQTGWTAGTPQSYIAASTGVTPEPSSLLLLGTGLCCAATATVRRRWSVEQS